jgi:DNA-binding response OmpR family regulator
MSRILIIEDDLAILRGLKDNLLQEQFEVLTASDGQEGYEILLEETPDLLILDLMLPGLNGYEICRRARKEGFDAPILMLTARGEEMDRVTGLDLGADDYVVKPFSLPELLARVRSLLRRSSTVGTAAKQALPSTIVFNDVVVDFKRFEATKGNVPCKLSRKEFGLLRLLASRPGEVVTREELLDLVWGHDSYPTTRTVDNHVASLRSKLEDLPASPDFLLTVHGVGYKLADADVTIS